MFLHQTHMYSYVHVCFSVDTTFQVCMHMCTFVNLRFFHQGFGWSSGVQVCMYVCMYMHIRTYVRTYVRTVFICTYIRIMYMYVRTYVNSMFSCVHAHMHLCIASTSSKMSSGVYVRRGVGVYVRTYVCTANSR